MGRLRLFLFIFFLVLGVFRLLEASPGDSDPVYRACVEQCQKTGCVGPKCFQHCVFSSEGNLIDGLWYLQEPLYVQWKQWDCTSDCRYHCMLSREEERQEQGQKPVKYHGKWPFKRVYGIQEPVSVALSTLNLAVQFHGWVSFFILVNYKLPFRSNKKTYYEYTGLWHIYAVFAMNAWFWNSVCHSRDVELIEKINHSSAVALLGFSLFLAVIRIFNIGLEAARVMVAAPIFAFIATHILYLNFYEFDLGWNTKVCLVIRALHVTLWAVWAGVTRHPSRWKLWAVMIVGVLADLLQVYDFAPYRGLVDAYAISHLINIPLTYLWWSFARDDSEFRTSVLIKKTK